MKRFIGLLLGSLLICAPIVEAQNWAPRGGGQSRQSGDIIPLRTIIQKIKREKGGRYLDARLFSKPDGGSVYQIDWEKSGSKIRYVVDARTGRIIRSNGG